MLEVLCTSSLPLRVSGLALILAERKKRETLMVYAGDLVWGILGSLHAIGGGVFKMPSCTERLAMFHASPKPVITNESVKKSLNRTFMKYGK